MLFNAPAASVSSGFPLGAWLRATTSGQPAATALSKTVASQVGEAAVFPLEAGRALLYYRDNSNFPCVQIGAITPAVGTAVTIVSSAVTLDGFTRIGTSNNFLFLINNDVYFIACGASGTTVTVTQISTDAGDAGRAEAFVKDIPYIEAAADGTHFIIANQFNNGGTFSFVTALWTLNVGTPSCTYVARDVDATGRNAAFGVAMGGKTSTAGSSAYVGTDAGATTTVYCNKITYTASTVANSVNTITTSFTQTSIASATEKYSGFSIPANNVLCFSWAASASLRALLNIDISGTPTKISESDSASNSTTISRSHSENDGTKLIFGASTSGSVTTAIRLRLNHPDGLTAHLTADLITGLTATATGTATGVDASGNYVYVIGEDGTNVGKLYVMKNTNA